MHPSYISGYGFSRTVLHDNIVSAMIEYNMFFTVIVVCA